MTNVTDRPDRWVILEFTNPKTKEVFNKVFGSWAGGYLDGDYWKLNSGISSVIDSEDAYFFKGYSGSCYKCDKESYGVAAMHNKAILDNILKMEGVKLLEDTDWSK